MRLSFRAFAVLTGVVVCGTGSACHDAATRPASSPTLGIAGSSAEVDIGAPAIRFALKQEPLLGLTASDGTGLRLAGMTAQAVIDGSVAFTELRLVFDNPESRTLEGRFRIALPSGASLQRFAMKIGEQWQESEVVELTAAREAYEDFLHRKQDPALLESSGGNEFSARVFPIPANGRKELVISYVQELRQDAYVLPLRGLPEVGKLDAQVNILGATKQPPRLALTNDKPSADLVVDLTPSSGAQTSAIRAGELVVAKVKPQAESKPDPLAATIVLVDTSASRAIGFEDELRTVSLVVARAAAAKGQLTVATFDQQITPIFEGAATSFGAADLAKIRAHGALGASNVQRALEWAGANAKKSGKKRIVLLSDGVATAGATDAKRLTATVSALRASGIERVDAVATGGVHDDAALLKLVRNLLPHDGVVAQASDPPDVIARRLDEATRSGVAVQIEGASWAWPAKLDGVQAGDEVSIYAEVPVGKPVKVALDGKPAVLVEPRVTARPLVERVVAQAQIASLLERELATQQDLKKEITALAVRHRVLTPYTAMLVLETEADFARFRIDRRSPPEVLAIDDGRIIKVARAFRNMSAPPPIDLEANEGDMRERQKDRKPAGTSATRRPSAPRSLPGGAPAADKGGALADRAPSPPRDSVAPPRAAAPPPSAPAPITKAAEKEDSFGGGSAASPRGGAVAAAKPARRPAAEPPANQPSPAATRGPAPRMAAAPAAAPADPSSSGTSSRNAEEMARSRDLLESVQRDSDGDRNFAEPPPSRTRPRSSDDERRQRIAASDEALERTPAYTGRFKEIMDQISVKDAKGALGAASAWRSEEPADVMALIALGESAEALGARQLAARSYGSIVDLFPNRADLRRFAGERLERIGDAGALELAIDTFEKARADRPDHPASHRLLAMAYLRAKQPQKAFEVLAAGLQQRYPSNRFRGVDRILREDLGLAAAAWIHVDPKREDEIRRSLLAAGGAEESGPSLRFVLVWETDANDVDFHIYDADGNHAFYSRLALPTGGQLYADVTTGYGPECFTVRGGKKERAGPYKLQAHYYSRGPMGYGMGKLQVVEHDGKGNLTFEERPFVVMNDQAFVDLGSAD